MPAASFSDFVRLGFTHIFTGYDHLCFLLGLLLACTHWRTLLVIISCFTLGHSLTLPLATLNLVNPPPQLSEPLIALTILFVGAENCWRQGEPPRGRWVIALLFGLVHGFGFANVLRELKVGADGHGMAGSLFGFNIGVELGQLFIAIIVLPLFLRLRHRPAFARYWVTGLSFILALAGLYWFVERTLFE